MIFSTIVTIADFSITGEALHILKEMASYKKPYVRLRMPFPRRFPFCLYVSRASCAKKDDVTHPLMGGPTLLIGPDSTALLRGKVIGVGPLRTLGIDLKRTRELEVRLGMREANEVYE